MKSITVEAKIENVDKVTEFVNEVLEEKDCPLKVQMQLDVAIDEITLLIMLMGRAAEMPQYKLKWKIIRRKSH